MTTLLTNNHHTQPGYREGIVERLFNDVFDSFWTPEKSHNVSGNIYDNGHEYLIEEAVPGMNKKDLKLTIDHNRRLVLQGKKEISKNNRKTHYQFSSGIQQTYVLPDNADTDHIRANVKDGLLRISIGKQKNTGYAKNISISGGTNNTKSIEDATITNNLWSKIKGWFK
ncbi:MAG: Hsp20 family protein [Bacteroidetes bacterium]|jgi:HSP20 family molecular chaperone IbpA|nr:Hsp20 family protein [Bacteroidota bacterium]